MAKVEQLLKEHVDYCRQYQAELTKRLETGSKTFVEHEGRIKNLEKTVDSLCEKWAGMNNRLNQILGSIVVAAILLAINLLVGRF